MVLLHPASCLVSVTSKGHEATSAQGAAPPVAPKHNLAPQPFSQPVLLSFQEAVASPDHSSSSPRWVEGAALRKYRAFAVDQGQQAQTCLHKDSHIRPGARMPPGKAVSGLHEPCRASSLCPRSAGTDASSSPAPPWQLWPPQGGERGLGSALA